MPDQIEAIPQTISATADGTDHELLFSAEFNPLFGSVQTAFIKIVAGTFKFNVGGPITETNASFTSADTIQPIPFQNGGALSLRYQCTSAGSFSISVI